MSDSDEMGAVMDAMDNRYFGKYRGKVENAADPMRRGRLLVKVPAILGESGVWAMPCVPYAGDQVGFYALPEPGTGVWVEFEGGNIDFPIWTGCFWADGQIPAQDAMPGIRFLRTKAITIRIDDNIGEIVIEDAVGSSIRLGPGEITLTSTSISQSAQGAKTVLSPVSFDVNNGAFTVV
jgi:hypothetical protein